jgi:hypothetical protein
MEIRTGEFIFPAGTGVRRQVLPFSFQRNVTAAHVALSGYDARYTSEDHHVRQLKVMLSARLGIYNGTGVEVVADFNLRDRNADDAFTGSIAFVLFVVLEDRLPPPIG